MSLHCVTDCCKCYTVNVIHPVSGVECTSGDRHNKYSFIWPDGPLRLSELVLLLTLYCNMILYTDTLMIKRFYLLLFVFLTSCGNTLDCMFAWTVHILCQQTREGSKAVMLASTLTQHAFACRCRVSRRDEPALAAWTPRCRWSLLRMTATGHNKFTVGLLSWPAAMYDCSVSGLSF